MFQVIYLIAFALIEQVESTGTRHLLGIRVHLHDTGYNTFRVAEI